MKKHMFLTVVSALGLLSIMASVPVREADAKGNTSKSFVPPTVFQGAGPTIASIQGAVDEFRAALGGGNNGNAPGPVASGRRDINWDGGGNNQTTTLSGNPFAGFQVTRGALFTTPDGTGFVQAPPAGLAGVFNNPTYETIFSTFSPFRLFSAIGSNITEVDFFVPGPGNIPATVTGFGVVFTDIDQPDGSGPSKKHGNRKDSRLWSTLTPTARCCSAASSRPRRATEAFPSSVSYLRTHASPGCESRAAVSPRDRMMAANKTLS